MHLEGQRDLVSCIYNHTDNWGCSWATGFPRVLTDLPSTVFTFEHLVVARALYESLRTASNLVVGLGFRVEGPNPKPEIRCISGGWTLRIRRRPE